MNKIKLNICSLEDPTNPKTWSGTPFNIYSELQKMDCLGSAFSSTAFLNKYERKIIDIISKFYYNNSVNTQRGFLYRYLNANRAKKETSKSDSNLTLHTGTLDLPFFNFPQDQKHYLFCDATWNSWSTYAKGLSGYSKKLIKDAEELERKAYQQIEHIFAISDYVKGNLVTHYGIRSEKITVVGTGTGVIKPYYGRKNYSNGKILFVAKGSFEEKGGLLVLETFKRALTFNSNLELIIVGQNDYVDKINLPNVKTYGFIPIEELQSIFNECALFFMPALNEAWGLVYLEALSCKMPIVGLNRNSFPEISGNGKYGFGFNEADPVKLSEAILDGFSKPNALEEIGIKGQEYCLDKYTWKNTVTKILETIIRLENK